MARLKFFPGIYSIHRRLVRPWTSKAFYSALISHLLLTRYLIHCLISQKYPEVPLYVKEAVIDTNQTKSFIMDTEVVAYNRETKQFVPFQILSTRKKTEESAESAKVQVIVQAFDLMYINGESLLQKTLEDRRILLKTHFQPIEGKFRYEIKSFHVFSSKRTLIPSLHVFCLFG